MRRIGLACGAVLSIVACGEAPAGMTDAGVAADDVPVALDAGAIETPDGGAGDDAGGTRAYGEACTASAQCLSGTCVGTSDVAPTCTRTCDINAANDCREENTFCVTFTEGDYCFGPTIETGTDASDDEVLNLGDCVTRSLTPLGDADMFLVLAGRSADVTIVAEPLNPALDLAADFYNNGQLVGRADDLGAGGREGLRIADFVRGASMQVVIRDAGSSVTDEYRLCVSIN